MVIVFGGNVFYSYIWNIGVVGLVFFGVIVGIYIVIVVDVFNNFVIKNIIVIQLDLVNVDIIVDNCILFIIIMVIGSGGELFYNYNWNIG